MPILSSHDFAIFIFEIELFKSTVRADSENFEFSFDINALYCAALYIESFLH